MPTLDELARKYAEEQGAASTPEAPATGPEPEPAPEPPGSEPFFPELRATKPGEPSAPVEDLAARYAAEEEASAPARKLHEARAAAREIDPDRAARAAKVAEQADIPVGVALQDVEKIERALEDAGFDGAAIVRENPLLASWLSSATNFAVAKDDINQIHGVMRLFAPQAPAEKPGFFDQMAAGLTEGSLRSERGAIGVRARQGQATPADMARVAEIDAEMARAAKEQAAARPGLFGRAVKGSSAQLQRMGTSMVSAKAGEAAGTVLGGIVGSAVPGAGTVAGATVGGKIGRVAGSVKTLYDESAGNSYLDYLQRGYSPNEALLWSTLTGAGEAGLEQFALSRYLKGGEKLVRAGLLKTAVSQTDELLKAPASAAGSALKEYGLTLATETTTEGLQSASEQAIQQVAGRVSGRSADPFSMAQVLEEAAGGFEASLLMGLPGVAGEYFDASRKIAQAERNKKFFANLTDATKRSALVERMPEKLAQVVQAAADAGGMSEFYMDVRAWNAIWAEQGHDPRQAFIDIVGDPQGYDAAMELTGLDADVGTSADIAIPSGVYTAKIVPSALSETFAQHTKLEVGGSSIAEAEAAQKELEARREEINASIGDEVAKAEEALKKSPDAALSSDESVNAWVEDKVQQAVAAGVDPKVAKRQLIPMVAFGTTLARRAGKSFSQIMDRYPMKIEDGALVMGVDESALGQAPDSGLPAEVLSLRAQAEQGFAQLGPSYSVPWLNGLTNDEARLEAEFASRIASDPESYVNRYAGLGDTAGGKIINADAVKALAPEYTANGSLAPAVHAASSVFADALLERRLAQPPETGRVMILAGGGGSGKTTAGLSNNRERDFDVVIDGTFSKIKDARETIQKAVASGREVDIVYIHRPIELAVAGAISRAASLGVAGRVVPLAILAKAHYGAQQVLFELSRDLPPGVSINVVLSRGGINDIVGGTVDDVMQDAYTSEADTLQRALDAYQRIKAEGQVPDYQQRVFESGLPADSGAALPTREGYGGVAATGALREDRNELSDGARALADRIAESLSRQNGPEPNDEVALPATLSQVQNIPEWKAKIAGWMRERGRSQAEIDEYIAGVEGQMRIFSALGPIELELLPKGSGLAEDGPIRGNADFIYKISFDASAMCVRRLEAAATASYMQAKLKRALTASERKALVALFRQAGKLSPCLYCYVESPRDKASEFVKTATEVVFGAQDVPAGWKGATLDALREATAEVNREGLSAADVDANVILDPEYAATAEAKAKMEKAPALYAYLRTVMLAAKANLPKVYEEYNGQILDIPDAIIQELNGYAGFRIFSTSDFQAEHVADIMQLFSDLALVGGKSHAYTKVEEFVKIFGETGCKIQTSIFARINRVTGEIEPDTQQGMDWAAAKRFRKRFKNVGPVMVATSDEVVHWALSQDWIDYIIPFHYSGLEERFFAAAGYSDFTSTQSEQHMANVEVKKTREAKKKSASGPAQKAEYAVIVDGEVRSTHTSQAEAEQAAKARVRMHQMDTAGGITNEEMTRRYLEICLRDRLIPVFPAFMFNDYAPPPRGLSGAELKKRRAEDTKKAVERWKAMVAAGEIDWSQINMRFSKLKKDYARTDTSFDVSRPSFNERAADEVLKQFLRGETPTATSDTGIGDRLIEMIEQNEKLASPRDLGADLIAQVEAEIDQKNATKAREKRPSMTTLQQVPSFSRDSEAELEAAERRIRELEARIASTADPVARNAAVGERRDLVRRLSDLRRDAARRSQEGPDERRGEVNIPVADAEGRRTFIIRLFQGRDLSTMLHEQAHVMLEILGDEALAEGASAEVRADYEALLRWFGVKDRSEIRRKHHERFAYAMEQYFMEGKAPSQELTSFFARVKEWMKSIYKELRRIDDLYRSQFGEGIELSDEVRGVFDRLLAADKDVQNAEGVNFYVPVFDGPRDSGMTPEQYEEYRRKSDEASRKARERQEQAMLADVRAAAEEGYEEALDALTERVAEKMNETPLYRAIYALNGGTKPDGSPLDDPALGEKISYKSLIALVGGPRAEALRRKFKFAISKKGGAEVSEIADTFGFPSGDALVEGLEQAEDRDKAARAEAKRQMEERSGALIKDVKKRQERAHDSSHNLVRANFLMTELSKLAELAGQRSPVGRAVIAAWAKAHIAQRRIRDIRPEFYRQAEVAAAKRAKAYVRKGDWAAAHNQKRLQLAYFFLYREALDAKAQAEKTRSHLQSRMSKKLRAAVGLAGKNFLDQLDTILEAVDLKKRPLRSDPERRTIGPAPPEDLASRQSLQEWVSEQIAEGREPAIPAFLLDAAFSKNWSDMTIEELNATRDAVDSVVYMARKKLGIDIAGKQAEWSQTHAALLSALRENMPDTGRMAIDPTQREGRFKVVTSLREDTLKIEELISRMDGRNANGIWAQLFIHPFSDAEAFERKMQAEVTAKLVEALGKMSKRLRSRIWSDKKYYFASIDQHLTMRTIYAVALNMGNESNLRKLLEGYNTDLGKNIPWTEDTVREIVDVLEKEDWDFIQSVWDTLESMWPEIEAMERRLVGLPPKKVERRAVVTKHGTYKGGYYPVIYDPARSKQGKVASEETALGMQFGPRAMTLNGHVQERVENFSAPIFLDLDRLPMHIMKVTHDLAFREALIAAGKVLNDREIWTELNRLVGAENAQLLFDHLKHMANPYRKAPDAAALDPLIGWAASRTTLLALGYNIGVALNNLANFSNALEFMKALDPKRGGRYMARGVKRFYESPRRMFQWVNQKSPEMESRMANVNDGLQAELQRLQGKRGKIAELQRSAYKLSAATDTLASYPLWIAAYERALDLGQSEAEAIREGDAAVRQALGAGGLKDTTKMTRGKLMRIIAPFMSFFNVMMNRQRAIVWDARRASENGELMQLLPSLITRQLLLSVVAPVIATAASGRWAGKDDDDEGWMEWLFVTVVGGAFAYIPVVRDAANNLLRGDGRAPSAAIYRTFDVLGDAITDPIKALQGEASVEKAVTSAAMGAGTLAGLPLTQLRITGGYAYDLATGQDEWNGLADAAWFVYRRPKEGR